jgi:two-component system response regulator FixJ
MRRRVPLYLARSRGVRRLVLKPTVFLVDDDLGYRQSLRFLLEEAGLDVADFESATAFLQAYEPKIPGCLVLDVRMPEMTGLELQEYMVDERFNLPIIFITGHGDVPMSVEAMKRGAMDFIEKPFEAQSLISAIKQAFARDKERRLSQARKYQIQAMYARLTTREREVMRLVVAGKSNKQIASALRVSPRTVEVHRARVMEKMESHSLPELINMAVVCGILKEA